MKDENKSYFEYLDFLRFFAFLAVFYAHTGSIFAGVTVARDFPLNILTRFTVYGSYGVNFFFVLSGFLITYLLLREKSITGKISIKNFYIKRIFRIWPVYFITLFFAVFVLPFLIPSETYNLFLMTNPNMKPGTIFYFLFFIGNFYQGMGLGLASLSIGILWSVCVEEQFYLVWPWIIKWFNIRKLTLFVLLIISLSFLYKFVFSYDRLANYYLPWSLGMDLAFGALLGIFYFIQKQKAIIKYSLHIIGSSLLLIVGVLIIVFFQTQNLASEIQITTIKSALLEIVRLVKTPFIDCIFILVLVFFIQKTTKIFTGNKHPIINLLHLSKAKIIGFLIYLGRISYGLYAYHTICLMLTVHVLFTIGFLKQDVNRLTFFVTIISSFIFTILTAHLSYIFIESKFLALKNKLK